MSKRLSIVNAIRSRLTEIQKANGFITDLGESVFYWKDLPAEYKQDSLIICDKDHRFERSNGRCTHTLAVEIKAVCFDDYYFGERGNEALEDIITLIGQDETWGSLATLTEIDDVDWSVETDGKTAVCVLVRLRVYYRTGDFEV